MLGNSFWRKAASCRWCKIGSVARASGTGILFQVGLNFAVIHLITEGGARFSGIFPAPDPGMECLLLGDRQNPARS
jgi:hypothetical protein